MTKKRLMSTALILTMLGLTACQGAASGSAAADTAAGTAKETTQQAGTSGAAGESAAAEPVTLTYWVPLNAAPSKFISSYNENTAYQEAMKRMGINIEFIHPAIGQELEEYNLLFLGDELPDIIAYSDHYPGGEFQGMRDGVFQNITDLVPQYAPDYYKCMTENEEFFRESTDNEGNIVSFNTYKPVADPPNRRWIFKKSLMDEIGCEVPKTVEELESVFAKIKEKGITPYLLDKNGLEIQLLGMYDMYYNKGTKTYFYQQDGQIKFAPIEDNFEKYLTLINKWYDAGYISKDFSSIKDTEANTLFDTDRIGTYLNAVVACYNRGQTQNFETVSAPYTRLEEEQFLHWEDYNLWPRVTQFGEGTVVVSKDCKNVEAALKFLNYGYTEEGAELYNWGVEGDNWDWQGDKRVYNDKMLNDPKIGTEAASYMYKVHFAPKLNDPDVECHANLLKSEGALASRMEWSNDDKSDGAIQLPPFQLGGDEQQRLAEIITPISTYVEEMTLKFITGAEPIENFEEFRATVKSMGIDEAIQLEQAGFEAYQSKRVK